MGQPLEGVGSVELREAFEALEQDRHAFEVYRRRQLAPGDRPTLQAIGEEMGLSRERVRQLEARFGLDLKRSLSNPQQPFGRAALFLAERLGGLSRVEALDRAFAELRQSEPTELWPEHRFRILLELAGPYEVDEEWCVRRSFSEEAKAALDRLVQDGPIPLGIAIEEVAALGASPADAEAWLVRLKDYLVVEEHLDCRGSSMADRGVTVLTVRGEPMTLDEVFKVLDEERSFAGFKNQMQADPRVTRRGIKHYGLTEWGGEEYTSVIDEMTQEIERRGGTADLEELAQFLHERFGVSPSSVRMYSQGAQFLVDANEQIGVASALEAPETKPLPLTRGCFRLRAGWSFRRTVDHDVLRGSGSAIPLGFAKELGLHPGESLRLETPYGPLGCSWPSHMAHIGSLRRAAEAHEACEGDYLFIVALGGGRADVFHAAATDWEKATDLGQLAKRCGCEESSIEDVAAALGLAAASASLETQLRQQLLHRGEGELAELLPDDDDDLLEALVDL